MAKVQESIDHSLLSNGLDFVHSSVEFINDNDSSKIKYAILHLFAGTLLVLKEKIHGEHWSFLFQKIEQANLSKFNAGDFESINYDRIKHVLQEVCQIKLNKDDVTALDELRKLRNKIEHFKFEIDLPTIKPTVAKVLSFLINFIEENLNLSDLSVDEEELFSEIKVKAQEFKEYVNVRLSYVVIYAKKNKKDLFHCPDCFEEALVKENDNFKCFVCNASDATALDVATAHLDFKLGLDSFGSAQDGADLPQYDCHECSEEQTLVPRDDEFKEYICVACGESGPFENMHKCSRCGQVYHSNEEGSCCSGCWSDLMEE